jgi:hypothetical protein
VPVLALLLLGAGLAVNMLLCKQYNCRLLNKAGKAKVGVSSSLGGLVKVSLYLCFRVNIIEVV